MRKNAKEVNSEADSAPMNRGLSAAKAAKQDEFYTQIVDIEREMRHYRRHFKGKVVYCNCDDPYVSAFFEYFTKNFQFLGLKKLITTCYRSQQMTLFSQNDAEEAIKLEYTGDARNNLPTPDDIGVTPLRGDGDFRSAECIAFLKEADIVVTNPPFSLFRQYVAQLVEHGKKFLIIGNQNAITYKEIFPLIKDNRIWLGCPNFNVGMFFDVPDEWERFHHIDEETGKKIAQVSTCWYTNLDHGRRNQPLNLMSMAENLKFSKKLQGKAAYDRYENYDAIEVSTYKEIPSDYDGVMGVPVTFLHKYDPDQFEIVGNSDDGEMMREIGARPLGREFIAAYRARGGTGHYSHGMRMLGLLEPQARVIFKRILIRHRTKPSKQKKK